MDVEVITEIAERNALGEGPLWDGKNLIYIDIVRGRIHRHNFASRCHHILYTEGKVGFAVLDEDERVIAGIGKGEVRAYDFSDHRYNQLLANPARDNEKNLANDGGCDRAGRLWFGTKNIDETAQDTGWFGHLDPAPGGGVPKMTEVLYPVHISNGIAWSPDNTKMYYNDSTDVWVMDYDIATGAAINRRDFIAGIAKPGLVPDGMTIDAAGRLYVAMWGGARVDVYEDVGGTGKLVETIPVPTALQTSSVAFGGDDLKTLFITSANVDLSPAQQAQYPDSGRLFRVDREIPGLPETRFNSRPFLAPKAA